MTLPHEPLGNRIAELSAHINAATAQLIELIAEFDECGGWADEGCLTCAHWLNWKCGVSSVAAREKVRVARALRTLPKIRDSFSRGVISYSKVRAMTRVATPASEEYLLMLAEHGTAAHMEKVVRGVRRVRADQELEESNDRHDRRYLECSFDDDGMLVVRARLDPEEGARFMSAIRRTALALNAERTEEPQAAPDFGNQRADALLRLMDGGKSDTEIVVHVSAEALRDDASSGCCGLEDGPAVSAETARRLSCDAGIVRLVEDPQGQPLDVGRKTRSIPPALRRALKARDGGCRFPGCDATAHVEGHHVRHWAHGGETSLANVVSLCRHHHRLVHEGGFTVEHRGDGVFRFQCRNGWTLVESAPRFPVDGCAQEKLFAANLARGLCIDADTGVTLWDGVRMDESMAVEGVLEAGGEFVC